AEYERMGVAGIFSEDDRVELIEGEIVEMSPIGKRHAACVGRLTQILALLLQRQVILWIQNPIQLSDFSEPQPDIALLKPRDDFYEHSLPTANDILLLIEVSDTTLEYDRQIKLPLYARSGVPEVWIVNLPDEQIETHAHPSGGSYQTTGHAARGDELQSHTLADLRLNASDILG
ncbi:MAG: Uma2 family endonuclease, partial [Acidobacteria bacterium]|nr:Uma2 family endonuclease [Acidobacteriota bacterium]